jgi:hypothetical protein
MLRVSVASWPVFPFRQQFGGRSLVSFLEAGGRQDNEHTTVLPVRYY